MARGHGHWTVGAYRTATRALTPLAPLLLSRRLKAGKEDAARIGERRGESGTPRPEGLLVWLHGASVGETLAVLPLLDRILARGFHVLYTSTTVTSAELAGKRLPKAAIHQFAPLDMPRYVARFLDHWRPNVALFAEQELWPNAVMELSARKTPLVLVNGRLSPRSFNRWQRFSRSAAALLSHFDLCLCKSAEDSARFQTLGAPRVETTGNIKFDVPPPAADAAALAAMQGMIGQRPVLLAASTHEGEERQIAAVHAGLAEHIPGLLTIIAPRHPERAPSVIAAAELAGLAHAQRSLGQPITPETTLYVADTIGEMGLFYRLATIAFVGGSLITHGGQNPIEPAKLGVPVLHGPHVANFADIYEALDAAGGAVMVETAADLARQALALLQDPQARETMVARAEGVLAQSNGALERTVRAIDPFLMQLRIGASG